MLAARPTLEAGALPACLLATAGRWLVRGENEQTNKQAIDPGTTYYLRVHGMGRRRR